MAADLFDSDAAAPVDGLAGGGDDKTMVENPISAGAEPLIPVVTTTNVVAVVEGLQHDVAALKAAGLWTADFNASVRSIFAHLTEAPSNFHQSTVFALGTAAPEDALMRRRAPMLFVGSALMVFVQCVTTMAVLVGTVSQSCSENENCPNLHPMFCNAEGRCYYCGQGTPL
eukprot:SAG31_NODE_5424_length_2546_cov_2.691050_3_plen_170_part_01